MLHLVAATLLYSRARLAELRPREQGITAVEYALMIAVVAALLLAGGFLLFNAIRDRFTTVGSCITASPRPPDSC